MNALIPGQALKFVPLGWEPNRGTGEMFPPTCILIHVNKDETVDVRYRNEWWYSVSMHVPGEPVPLDTYCELIP
jgi:hypothetical protein